MTKAVTITVTEMDEFLTGRGFQRIHLPGVHEHVYGRIMDKEICLRIYTSIEGMISRGTGSDAIRCVLMHRDTDGVIRLIGADKRVHRVQGWRINLAQRINNWREMLGPPCPKCGKPTQARESKRGPFWGCIGYPQCVTFQPIERKPAKQLA
jgi:hypothetical protein